MRATVTMPIETLAFIIAKAREVEGDVDDDEAEVDEDELDEVDEEAWAADEDDVAEADEEDDEDDEFVDLLVSLSDDELAQLLALMWVGGGDYDEESWDEALSRARALGDQDTLTHLLGVDALADLIEEGLIELGYGARIERDAAAP
jgi:hypothetical protein